MNKKQIRKDVIDYINDCWEMPEIHISILNDEDVERISLSTGFVFYIFKKYFRDLINEIKKYLINKIKRF